MLTQKAVGRKDSAIKYDIITALGAHALACGKHEQRLVLRLITLITARYNWQRESLTVGQREIARLWSVDERTVKRDMAKLRALGWLVVKRQGARGRVTEYSLDSDSIFEKTRPQWPLIGPDFELRLGAQDAETAKVLPLSPRTHASPPSVSDGTEWALAQAVLYSEDSLLYGNWFHALKRADRAGGRLVLQAPTRFHASYVQTHLMIRLLSVCQSVDDTVDVVELIV